MLLYFVCSKYNIYLCAVLKFEIMATKNKEIAKVKEPIRLRIKKLANGSQSLYLDFYFEGKREYEFLKLYLVPETSAANSVIEEGEFFLK